MYGDPHHHDTSTIWQEVTNFVVQNHDKPTFCMGDLNNIMHPRGKWGPGPFSLSRIHKFSLFKQCGLFDLGYSGPAYTWSNKRFNTNRTFERLDRCLANADWCQVFPNTTVYHLPMLYSDDAPILAIMNSNIARPKRRFRFENWWLAEDGLHETAVSAWRQTNNKPFHLRTHSLAKSLKIWVKKKKPITQQLFEIEKQLLDIQQAPPHLADHSTEASLTELHNSLLDKLTEYYRQGSKKHWATKGARNTRFFQQACTRRRQKNMTLSITSTNSNMLSNPEKISQEFINYFSNLFTSSLPRFRFTSTHSHEVTMTNEYTNSTPSIDECFQILKDMRSSAAPGPDGLNVAFYRVAWPRINEDVHKLVADFYTTGVFPEPLNYTDIVLIPKNSNANLVTDYRPISLTNVAYRIIAKSLANRIKHELPDYIHHSQHAFIQGRRITDNIIIAQEIVHSFHLKSFSQQAFMLKIDLAKAFDRLEWPFILDALRRKGFHDHLIDLIHACISSANFSVNINGQSYGCFQGTRGIRQGCPLSPYIFVLVVNELSIQLQGALQNSQLTGVILGPTCPPSTPSCLLMT
jgi:hypothetical protein